MIYDFGNWIDSENYYVKGFEVIDLSEKIHENAEVPGEKGYSDPDTQFKRIETKTWVSLAIKPYYISKIVMGSHVGTHIDSPMHAKESGFTIDQIPNEYIGPVKIIEANEALTAESLSSIKSDSIVLIRGKSNYKMPDEFRMHIIRSKPRLAIFGDCVNVDGVEDTIKYLQNDIPMIMGAKQSAVERLKDGDIIFAMPIKFTGIEAAPVRLFALKLNMELKETKSDNSNLFSFDEE